MTAAIKERVLNPVQNVGGGDLASRISATALLTGLVVLLLPRVAVPYSLLKIALLVASELGLTCLLLGMFLRSKTYFAGLQLFLTSLAMLGLAARGLPYAGMMTGLLFIAVGLVEILSRRSRLNALLGLSSYRGFDTTDATLVDMALQPEAAEPKPSPLNGHNGMNGLKSAISPRP